MTKLDQSIPCPVCKTAIPFDTRQLLLGIQFVCSNCQAAVGLAPNSKPQVEEAMNKLDEIKGKSSGK